ncbi:39S ribosomal protein L44, mitochondrial [Galendromus occidentalis]|uniref:39S ribosomal protein L44, mitochondrial n=1 Tax=Galendromus occidentalis TaxID=34638 RepID=A0AAJ6VYC0_9ACAR|nr:39S ribosomal protein L44, mitochondrial [Galendromus occidentalis]
MLTRKCLEASLALGVRGYKRSLFPTLTVLKKRQDKVGVHIPQRSAVVEWDFDREVNIFCKRFSVQPGPSIRDAFRSQAFVENENEQRVKIGLEPLALSSNKQLAESGLERLREVLTTQISEIYPKLPQQGVEAVRNFLCSPESLTDVASQMGFAPLVIRPGDGEAVEPELMREAFLAVFGSIENQGDFCRRYVLIQLAGKDIMDIWHPIDVSQLLNSILKKRNQPPYEPRLIGDAGRNTLESVFYVAIYSDRKFLGKGAHETQAAAVDVAVRDALKRVFGITRAERSPFEIMALKSIYERNAGLTTS